ncbi:MAG: ABC transporter permease [Candidatus Tectomicrobia bacterium]|nr:ABC transporter permease [Candidatus Tectomicrobia bacterium]
MVSTEAEVGSSTEPLSVRSGRLPWLIKRHPTMIVGIVLLVIMSFVALGAPIWTKADPLKISPVNRLKSPSAAHWFGTDHLGRDIYARTIYGSRISLLVGLCVSVIGMVTGLTIGLISGYYSRVDLVVMRIMDGIMAIPAILLAIALMALVSASVQNVIIALSIPEIPRVVRVVRASVLSLRERLFVEATRAAGAGVPRILIRHIMPNTLAPLIVQGTYICASAIIVEAYLSFLGAGTPPHIPSWGNIMAEGRSYVQLAFWIVLFPGVFLALTVLAINLVGDGLRDTLDPKIARRM